MRVHGGVGIGLIIPRKGIGTRNYLGIEKMIAVCLGLRGPIRVDHRKVDSSVREEDWPIGQQTY